jgi:RNA polymerase sigma factor (sigma-70 family)
MRDSNTHHHDEVAFRQAFERYAPRVRQYIARRVAADDVDDVLEDVFVVLWRKRGSVQWDTSLEWWLLRVAYRCVGGSYRARRRRDALALRLIRVRETSDTEDETRTEMVRDALSRLERKDQEVLQLTVWDELPAREAAYVLGVSQAAFEKRLQRAKRRFQEQFNLLSETTQSRTLNSRREP